VTGTRRRVGGAWVTRAAARAEASATDAMRAAAKLAYFGLRRSPAANLSRAPDA
jgi:hypothetical protein